MNSRWKQYLLHTSLIIVGGGLIYLLVETLRAKNTGFETKTLWDWMELLIVPLFLAGGAFLLNRSERKSEHEIATDHQQEAALQSYLDRMAELLLERKLLTTEDDEVRDVARVRTLSVLRGLDAVRKGLVINFLYEANLISRENPIVNLKGADLQGSDLRNTNLEKADLSGANLQAADLRSAYLQNADLQGTNLRSASLRFAILGNATMRLANLEGADLQEIYLSGATLRGARLQKAHLERAKLQGAFLFHADLRGANLQDAHLVNANLRDSDLTGTDFKGATMPDGTKHD